MGISIDIVAGEDQSVSKIVATGRVQHVITDAERDTFKLTDLKEIVNKYFGKVPNDAFLHSPTPWDDLYKRYGWAEVQTNLVVQSAEILGITSQPTILNSTPLENNSDKRGTFHANIHQTINETTTSSWNTGGTLTIGETAEVSCEFLGVGAKVSSSFSYSQSWGIGGEHSNSVEVGDEAGVEVELDPGESVVAVLTASRGVMKVRIRYNAYLTGYAAVNYNPIYKDHHFWALEIDYLLGSAGISNSVISTEDIEIGYYSNIKVELRNKKTGDLKAMFLVESPRVLAGV